MMKVVARCWSAVALQLCLAMCFSGVSSTPSFPGCDVMKPDDASSLGDGVCDMLYNIQDCGYDGGDCCPCTCLVRRDRGQDSAADDACGSSGYHCLDPMAPCLAEHETALRELQSGSDADTGSTYTNDGSNTGEGSYANEGSYTDEGSYTEKGSSTDSRSPTSAPTGAPTMFSNSNEDIVDALSTATDDLSGSAIWAIVGVCLVVVLIGGAIYLHKKHGGNGGGGSNAPNFAAADSASLT